MRYFNGLDTLRLYAALGVIVAHLHNFGGVTPPFWLEALFLSGQDSVTLFFTLSGFIITTRLLQEKRDTHTVNVREFYQRRFLRIVPLYALGMSAAYLLLIIVPRDQTLPDMGSTAALLLFSAHIGHAFGSLGILAHYWSLGVEEWFYAVWPLVMKRGVFVAVCIGIIVLRAVVSALAGTLVSIDFHEPLLHLIALMRVEAMAIGALGAWVLLYRPALLTTLLRFERMAWMLLVLLAIAMPVDTAGFLIDGSVALVSLIVILAVAVRGRLQWAPTCWLGKRSYGVYIWHTMVIHAVTLFVVEPVLATVASMAITVLVALASYRWVEMPAMRLKGRQRDESEVALRTVR